MISCQLFHSFIRSFIHSFISSFINSFIYSFIHSFHSFIRSFIHSYIPRFLSFHSIWLHPSIHPSIHSFIHSFHSFIVFPFISCHVISNQSCSIHSLLSNSPRIPISKRVPIAMSYFQNFRPGACRALPGNNITKYY